jgi:ubiquinone/menaquinone biosynthesis C-methylase UbiE
MCTHKLRDHVERFVHDEIAMRVGHIVVQYLFYIYTKRNNLKFLQTILFLLTFTAAEKIFAQTPAQFTKTDSASVAQQKQRLAFLNLSASDSIADIGTSTGYSLIPIANAYPKLHFTVQDIDSTTCNPKKFLTQIKRFGNLSTIDQFSFCYGTEKSSNLPSNRFTKVLITDVIHELTYRTEMLEDLKRILAPNGSLFVEEILVHKAVKKDRICNYPFLTEPAFKNLFTENQFQIIKEELIFDTGKNRYIKIFEIKPI